MMHNTIHRLPGSTGSNTVERKHLKSEKRAAITLTKLREIIAYRMHAYHDTKHSALGKSPAAVWTDYYAKHPGPRLLDESQHEEFKYRFYPEIHDKRIVPDGIELFRRFYYSSALKDRVRALVMVKYDPYDISFIRVKIDEVWTKVPCVRNSFTRSSDYEMYRWERQQRGDRDGTMTAAGAESQGQIHIKAKSETQLTSSAKRARKKQKGVEDYAAQSATRGTKAVAQAKVSNVKANAAKNTQQSPKKKWKSNIIDITSLFKDKSLMDFDEPLVFYESSYHFKP